MKLRSLGWLAGSLALSACGGAGASPLARAAIDTLPSGVVRVSNQEPTAWRDTLGWRLVEVVRFSGQEESSSELVNPHAIAVDEAGRVYVADQNPAALKIYDADGSFVRAVGRQGDGPGEFRVGFIALRGAHVALHDPQGSRTTLFDTAGTYLRSWRSSCCYWTDIWFDRASRIAVPAMSISSRSEALDDVHPGPLYVRYDTLGRVVDSLRLPANPEGKSWTVSSAKNRMMMSLGVPFTPGIAAGFTPDGGVLFGLSSSYQIALSRTGKDTTRLITRTWTPAPITDEQRTEAVEQAIRQQLGGSPAFQGERPDEKALRAVFRKDDIPTTLPSFDVLRVDGDGFIWARLWNLADTTRSHFDVFDSTGSWLGRVIAPVKFPAYGRQAWGRSQVAIVSEDELGRPVIIRFRIDRLSR